MTFSPTNQRSLGPVVISLNAQVFATEFTDQFGFPIWARPSTKTGGLKTGRRLLDHFEEHSFHQINEFGARIVFLELRQSWIPR